MENRSNKTIVTNFYKTVIGERDLSQVDTYISDHYIQHSAMGKDGKAGIMEMLQFLKTLPQPEQNQSPVTMVIGDGELVAIQLDINFMGKRALVVDVFRVAEDKLAEHWDVVQYVPGDTANSLNREIHLENDDSTPTNKLLIKKLFDEILIPKQFGKVSEFLQQDQADEPGWLFNGRLNSILSNSTIDYQLKVYQIIGEGNLVLVQSSYQDADTHVALNDIFQIADGQIIKHWCVEQAIPDSLQHSNGML